MIRRLSLSQRLALVFTSLLLLCAIAVCLIQLYSSAQYGNVMVQRLSAGLAQRSPPASRCWTLRGRLIAGC